MEAFLLIPKEAPYLCLHVDDDDDDDSSTSSSPICFRAILPPNHPGRYKQEWSFEDDSILRLAKSPQKGVLIKSTLDPGVIMLDRNLPHSLLLVKWKKMKDTIVQQGLPRWGLGVSDGEMKEGSRVVLCPESATCRFEFTQVQERMDNNEPSHSQRAHPTEEPGAEPDVPTISSIAADLSLLFGAQDSAVGRSPCCTSSGNDPVSLGANPGEKIGVSTLRGGSVRKYGDARSGTLTCRVGKSTHNPRTMKAFLFIPKKAPHLCLQVDGDDAPHGSRIVFGAILPPDHPNRYKQLWVLGVSHIKLAQRPSILLYRSTLHTVAVWNRRGSPSLSRRRWETIGDKIVSQHNHFCGLSALERDMKDGTPVVLSNNDLTMCRFAFREVEWNENKDVPKEPNPQEKTTNPTVEPETKPDVPTIARVTADLSLRFGMESSSLTGSYSAEICVVKGYSSESITISAELHKELCAAAIEEGSILARKVKDRCQANVGRMLDQSLQIPRDRQETKFQLAIELGSPCFVYQVRFEATMQDGTIIEYYGGHFISDDVIDLDNDDDKAPTDSNGEPIFTWEVVPMETTVEPSTSETVDEETAEGHFVLAKAVEWRDSAEESHCDSSDWEDVVME